MVAGGKPDTPPDAGAERSPKVLFKDAPLPSVVEAKAQGGPAVLFGTPRPPAPRGQVPRVLASGEVRQRIPCSHAALLEIEPAASPVVAKALRIVDGTNLDDHHFDDVIRFGAPLQAEHGRLAEEELALVGNEALAQGRLLGAELLERLRELDPEAVFSVRGGVFKAIKALAGGQDPDELFARHYPPIQALGRQLDALAPDIEALAEQLRAIGDRYIALETSLSAHILAGNFLVRHVGALQGLDRERQAHFASQAEAIATRVASLLATKATVEVGRRTLEALARNMELLAWSGQGLVREELPAWHTAYSAALLAARTASRGTDAISALQSIHARILGKLTSKG